MLDACRLLSLHAAHFYRERDTQSCKDDDGALLEPDPAHVNVGSTLAGLRRCGRGCGATAVELNDEGDDIEKYEDCRELVWTETGEYRMLA